MIGGHTVIFDFDGTLVDSFSVAFRLTNAAAREHGFRVVSPEDIPRMKELPLKELFRILEVPVHKLPLMLARARSDMKKELPTIPLFDGMRACIARLKEAGFCLGIVSSNSRSNVEECLDGNGVRTEFDFIHSASNLFGKHRVLRQLLRKYGIRRESVVYVGDESRDIEASRRCHIEVVAVSWGYQSRNQLASMKPDFLAEEPLDIARFLIGRYSPLSPAV